MMTEFERPVQIIFQDCDVTIQNNSKGIIFKRSRRDRRATDNHRQIISGKSQIDEKSLDWLDKYGSQLWIP